MSEEQRIKDLKARYGVSQLGQFEVVDTIGVPHPFTIGVKHVEHASKLHSGRLGEETCKAIPCAHPGCRLKYSEHGKALLVACYADMKDSEGNAVAELRLYLLGSKEMAETDGYAGFAFLDKRNKVEGAKP